MTAAMVGPLRVHGTEHGIRSRGGCYGRQLVPAWPPTPPAIAPMGGMPASR